MSKIILWDIETSHITVRQWSLWDQFTSHDNIIEDWYIICAAYKELGKKKVSAVSVIDDSVRFKINPRDDYHVVEHMYNVLKDADVIIHHYGDNFDIKKFNARLVFHGFQPLPPLIQIDTKKMASSKFKFTSNKLDYLGEYLGVGKKIKTENSLWIRCEAGERKAVLEMVKYNKQDVSLLEKVYNILAPFVPAKFNRNIVENGKCPSCGSTNIHKRGVYRTRTRLYQRHQCNDCGHWARSNKSEKGVKSEVM